ncbi:MAG: hypothetical protein ACYCVB_17655 [Bacilli bacterium]
MLEGGRRWMKKTVHVISRMHWDREWYMPFERHRVRLVKLIDTLLETLFRNDLGAAR